MQLIDSIILGFVQGVTEFVPISSSGHLIIVREWLGISPEGSLLFDAVLHLATACAVLVYFRKDIVRLIRAGVQMLVGRHEGEEDTRFLLALIPGIIPVILVGLFFEDVIEHTLRSPHVVVWSLLVGAVALLLGEYLGKENRRLTLPRGLGIGLFQVFALIPGFSRSGATIGGGMLLGLKREEAVRFSFIMSLPLLLGVGGRALMKAAALPDASVFLAQAALGGITAFLVGLGAIYIMMKLFRRETTLLFVGYRVLLALLLLLL